MPGPDVNLKPHRILIVDELAPSRKFIADICRSFGAIHIGAVDSSDRAFSALEQNNWDILVCKWGDQVVAPALLKRIRFASGRHFQRIRVVVLRPGAKAVDVEVARDAGADQFVMIPVARGPMLAAFHRVTSEPQHFVDSETYKGPCRRRRRAAWEKERRKVAASSNASATAGAAIA